MVRAKNPESFEKIHSGDFEIFRISYVALMPSTDCAIPVVGVDIYDTPSQNHKNGVDTVTPSHFD